VQVDPIKHTLKAPGPKYLKLEYDRLLLTFAFKFNLRRFNTERMLSAAEEQRIREDLRGSDIDVAALTTVTVAGTWIHSSTFQLNLGRVGHTSPRPPVL